MEQFERVRILGEGSYGTATLVCRKASSSDSCDGVAQELHVVKEVDLKSLQAGALSQTMREVDVLRSLTHVNIIAYHDAFIERDTLHIVMEYANGGDLQAAIDQRRSSNRHFSEEEAVSIFSECCCALQYIHAKNILHRDIKAQNIFLSEDTTSVKIGDFGIARILEDTQALARTAIGTPTHLPPEMCNGKKYGTKADMWSLGIVFYETLALELPFQASCIAALVVKICNAEPKPVSTELYGKQVRNLVRCLLQKDPKRRPDANAILATHFLRQNAKLPPISCLPPAIGADADTPRSGAVTMSTNPAMRRHASHPTRLPSVTRYGIQVVLPPRESLQAGHEMRRASQQLLCAASDLPGTLAAGAAANRHCGVASRESSPARSHALDATQIPSEMVPLRPSSRAALRPMDEQPSADAPEPSPEHGPERGRGAMVRRSDAHGSHRAADEVRSLPPTMARQASHPARNPLLLRLAGQGLPPPRDDPCVWGAPLRARRPPVAGGCREHREVAGIDPADATHPLDKSITKSGAQDTSLTSTTSTEARDSRSISLSARSSRAATPVGLRGAVDGGGGCCRALPEPELGSVEAKCAPALQRPRLGAHRAGRLGGQ